MNGSTSEPPHLTPTQAMRWRAAQRAICDATRTDINALDRAGRTLAYGKLRAACADLARLVEETRCHTDNK